ncbi:MAG: DUF2293 domain-containing protein [Planctomycetota bacterium]
MSEQTQKVTPGPRARTVRMDGRVVSVPKTWELVPPGDAALTRRIKAGGPSWLVQEKKGRRTFSRGVWAEASRVAEIREQLQAERATDSYQKRRVADAKRREKKQVAYVEDFHAAVVAFLDFDSSYSEIASRLASAVTKHATPVGSGTVARTQRIPIERRAESAVIAWMRHQTTAYDHMKIPRVKGMRREVRRMLAEESRRILKRYRDGATALKNCPLNQALK